MQRTPFFPKREPAARAENFAFTVTGYDTSKKPHSVSGVRIDNGESVRVTLRDIKDLNVTYQGSNVRSEIADFAAPRAHNQHPGTIAGGVLLAQDAFKQADGSFAARWLQSLSHRPGEAHVFVALAHVGDVRVARAKGDGSPPKRFSMMTFLHDGSFGPGVGEEGLEALKVTPPFKVDSAEVLKDATTALLADGLGVGIRLSNAEGFDAIYISRGKDETNEAATSRAMENVKDLIPAIEGGELTCEVIPYSNVFSGPKTTDIIANNKVVQGRLKQYHAEREEEGGKTYPVTVFRPTIVAVRLTKANEHGQQSAFFTHFEPLYSQPPIHGLVNAICHAKTEHLCPEVKPPAPLTRAQPANSAPGADAPGAASQPSNANESTPPAHESTDGAAFSAGFDDMDDDLMDAANRASHDLDVPQDALPPQATVPPAGRRFQQRRALGAG